MALSLGLEKRRHRDGHAWIDSAILIRGTVLSGRGGFWHFRSGVAEGCFQSVNVGDKLVAAR